MFQLRNKLNEQQNSKLALHRETLVKRKEDMAKMDSRIAELQNRLRKKKAMAQNAPVISTATTKSGSLPVQKTLEPFHKSTRSDDIQNVPMKTDPKYQTLPYNIKLTTSDGSAPAQNGRAPKETANIYDIVKSNRDSTVGVGSGASENNNKLKSGVDVDSSNLLTLQRAAHDDSSGSNCSSPRGSAHKDTTRLMSNFAPKPYGTTYTSSANTSKSAQSQPLNISTNATASPSVIYAASGMPQSDSLLDTPKISTPITVGQHRPSAREMFMMGKQQEQTPPATTTTTPVSSAATTPATTSSSSVAVSKPPASSYPSVLPVGGKFFPALTVETSPVPSSSPASISPAGLSPQTSAIVRGGSLPVYQVASSTRVSSASAYSSTHVSSHTPTKTTSTTTPTKSSASFPSSSMSTPPGSIQVASSQKVQLSQRLSSVESPTKTHLSHGSEARTSSPVTTSTSATKITSPTTVASLPTRTTIASSVATSRISPPATITSLATTRTSTTSSNSLAASKTTSSVAPISTPPKAETKTNPPVSSSLDTSGASVNDALSVLMNTGATTSPTGTTASTTASKPTYRYAPRSVIANTYMSKLGSGALDQYRKNMSQLYSSFPGTEHATEKGEGDNSANAQSTDQTTAPVGSTSSQPEHTTPTSAFDSFANGPGTPSKDAERLRYRPNAPRPLRRRLSTGDSPPTGTTAPKGLARGVDVIRGIDVVRVDAIQDAYNNNNFQTESTSFTGPDNIPYADSGDASPVKRPTSPPRNTTVSPTITVSPHVPLPLRKKKGSSLKSRDGARTGHKRRVSFDPLALLLDASLEGELELVKQCAQQVNILKSIFY